MSNYKVIYFNIKGIAEPIRLLLNYGNVNFEDVRVRSEDWHALKPTMPFGVLPVLEVDGKKLHQSLALARYLGKRFGLGGNDELEDLEIDAVADAFNDFRDKVTMAFWRTDPEVKAKKLHEVHDTIVPFYAEKFDTIAIANNGHLALGRLTWADFQFVGAIEYLSFMSKTDILNDFQGLKTVYNNVVSLPTIKDWIAKRPKTDL